MTRAQPERRLLPGRGRPRSRAAHEEGTALETEPSAPKSQLLAAARALQQAAATAGIGRAAAARAVAIAAAAARREAAPDFLALAARRVRATRFEGRLGDQMAAFLELLDGLRAGRGPDGAPSGPSLSLADAVFVDHWARRLIPEGGGAHGARGSAEARAGGRPKGPAAPAAPPGTAFAQTWERAQQAQRGHGDARGGRGPRRQG